MADTTKRVLFVNSEIFPYLPETEISSIGRKLPQGIQERKKEIRSFMPRFGCINERKNQLHDVIRLSGMNIIIGDMDRPLIIKVASISAARIQVYFIDNEDYFRRKALYCDEQGEFFKDNAERAIFFARGVLETVKKLRWSPDIIHCSGWISHILPLYLKKCYKDDPIFEGSKVVLSLCGDVHDESFCSNMAEMVKFQGVADEDVKQIENPTGINVAKLAIDYSDGVIVRSEYVPAELLAYAQEKLPVMAYDPDSLTSGTYVDRYKNFYDNL